MMHNVLFVGGIKKGVNILWSCQPVQDVSGCGTKKLQKSIGEGLTFFQVIGKMLERRDLVELELMAVVARKIWFRRNVVVHGSDFSNPN